MALRIFLSYRRADTGGKYLAHMIFRELRTRYGDASAFLDVDSRNPGLSFPEKVQNALNKSNAVLVVIGPEWLTHLKQREHDEHDWVRYEIAESLRRRFLPVVPVCHAAAELPAARQLPLELRELASRDGVSLDPFQDFDSHLSRLLEDLERVVQDQQEREISARKASVNKSASEAAGDLDLIGAEVHSADAPKNVDAIQANIQAPIREHTVSDAEFVAEARPIESDDAASTSHGSVAPVELIGKTARSPNYNLIALLGIREVLIKTTSSSAVA